jgi:ubiquinone/menaquinone biosynthesis C-methylase UbiE
MKGILEFFIKVFTRITMIFSQIYDKYYSEKLYITYELIYSLPTNAFDEDGNNARGTHLNESGDTQQVEEYVKKFSLEKDIHNLSVIENLFFLDNFVVPLLPVEAEVVDVGCGIGRYEKFLHRQGSPTQRWQYTGVDRTEDILAFARALCPQYEFRSSENSIKIPYPDNSKDLVLASGMLQCTCDQWLDSLQEMQRVSRKYIFVSRFPIVRRIRSTYCHQTVIEKGNLEHHYFKIFNRQEFESKVIALGCHIIYKDYGAEMLSVKGISEPVVLNQYLIAV